MRNGSRLVVLVLACTASALWVRADDVQPGPAACGTDGVIVETEPSMVVDEPWGLRIPCTRIRLGWPDAYARRREPLTAVIGRWLGPPPGRHRGVGWPLENENWLDEPLSLGWFIGGMQGGTVIEKWLSVDSGITGGFRFGGDVGHYWGFETRFLAAELGVEDHPAAIAAARLADTGGDGEADLLYDVGTANREANFTQWDLSVVYYPWGEAAWRPYLAAGLGRAKIEVTDRLSQHYEKTMLAVPLAVGVKYRVDDWMAVRVEVADMIHVAGSDRFATLHNLTYTAGAEFRFGGRRRAYWPWNPSRHFW